MKNIKNGRYDFFLPVIASIIYFFAVKQVIPQISYAVIVSLFGIYFFPVKLFLNDMVADNSLKSRITEFISVFVFAAIMVFSIILLFEKENPVVNILFEIVSVVNVFFVLYYAIIDNKRNTFITHFGFTVLAAAVLGI